MKTVLVLGANGGIGKVVAQAFVEKGWRVMGLVRQGQTAGVGVTPLFADLFDTQAVARAAQKVAGPVDVVFNGLNAPYTVWPTDALPLYTAAADVTEALGARQIYPGSVYNFGSHMPPVLTPKTPFAADTVKGKIRVAIETLFSTRSEAGQLKTIVIRAGDFFGAHASKSWMNALVAKDLGRGKITTPGKYQTVHAWAFLPDLADAIVRVAEVEKTLGAYEVFHFENHNVTARQLAEAGRKALGRKVSLGHMPRLIFSVLALFDPFMRAALEMLYLWDVPHALRDERLASVIGDTQKTPLEAALRTLI